MSRFVQYFQESLRANFGATVFMLVAGVIAFVFIGYLVVDYIKNARDAAHRRKKHRGGS